MTKIKLDGRDYEFGSEAHLAKIDEMHKASVDKLTLDAKDLSEKLTAAVKRGDVLEAERDDLKVKVEKINTDAEMTTKDKAKTEAIDMEMKRLRRKRERIALRYFGDDAEGDDKNETGEAPEADSPASPLGTEKPGAQKQKRAFPPGAKAPPFTAKDGGQRAFPPGAKAPPFGSQEEKTDSLEERIDAMSDRDLMVFCISKAVENFDATGKTDDYIAARFDMVTEEAQKDRGIAGVVDAARRGAQNLDANVNMDEVTAARKKRDDQMANAWKDPPKTG